MLCKLPLCPGRKDLKATGGLKKNHPRTCKAQAIEVKLVVSTANISSTVNINSTKFCLADLLKRLRQAEPPYLSAQSFCLCLTWKPYIFAYCRVACDGELLNLRQFFQTVFINATQFYIMIFLNHALCISDVVLILYIKFNYPSLKFVKQSIVLI